MLSRRLLSSIAGVRLYGFFGGGLTSVKVTTIDYIELATTTGNALDKGDLSEARWGLGGVSGNNYGFFGGGRTTTDTPTIDYIDVTTTTGNALD